ncbi:Tetratricopeptide TPR_1 repeat-containing protein [Pseudodesulfovibrio mercurii]|uniref:Tetratricopeptide TPR_1 repeat-containing protein n=1 Tax=Pseudodesulfovibrio mercurii TaxID=641491 RepID=F0JKU2_9BACT|nr:tetratricopeptide repeat protein [Pseudodesulfovibrio mercurii]EGB16541.1 Tetratricopeptide TPR_1 repeat-containing protein [Pseudodesulfovibrio mercurii]
MKKNEKHKSLYLVRTEQAELQELEARRRSETKNLYVVKTDEEVANKYRDVIVDFADDNGVFLVVSHDKTFIQTFRSAVCQAVGVPAGSLHAVQDLTAASILLKGLSADGASPFLFLEYSLDSELTISYLRHVKPMYPDMRVAVISREINRERLFQFYEDGADSFLKKPASINSVIKKIAFMLKPRCEADALVCEGREHVRANRFEEAQDVAEHILERWPRHAAAMVLLGDAKKGLARREEAMLAYRLAEDVSSDYLEPLQKIAAMHCEDDNRDEALKYLCKLDHMSPLNCSRKIRIAEMHFERGDSKGAEEYFDKAIDAAKEEALGAVGEMSLDIAEMASRFDPGMAAKYYRRSLELVKNSKSALTMSVYNRLGISLRKQGLWNEAIEAYGEAARYAPEDENIQYNISLAYGEGQQYRQAAEHMRNALVINPDMYRDNPALAYTVGSTLARGDMPREAIEILTYLLEIAPGYQDAEKLLREVTAGRGRPVRL